MQLSDISYVEYRTPKQKAFCEKINVSNVLREDNIFGDIVRSKHNLNTKRDLHELVLQFLYEDFSLPTMSSSH